MSEQQKIILRLLTDPENQPHQYTGNPKGLGMVLRDIFKPQWMPVSELLPELRTPVLGLRKNDEIIVVRFHTQQLVEFIGMGFPPRLI